MCFFITMETKKRKTTIFCQIVNTQVHIATVLLLFLLPNKIMYQNSLNVNKNLLYEFTNTFLSEHFLLTSNKGRLS